jgi:pimeloyl-ACP methyl ester carboxylesterase
MAAVSTVRDEPRAVSMPIPGGRIEHLLLPGGPGVALLVLGGVETGLRPLAGTESAHMRRWERRTARRPVLVVGRPLPDNPSDADRLLHPRLIADAVASVLRAGVVSMPVAVEAESGGGRISLWLAVDHPELVARLILASAASETPSDSAMTGRMAGWLQMAERGAWAEFFAQLAQQLQPSDGPQVAAPAPASAFQPRPSTPERFIGELRATLDPSTFVTDRLAEIAVPTLVLAGGQDQVVPPEATRLVADRIPGARFLLDPHCGHTVRGSFAGYDELVEAFLAEGDP